MKYEESKKALGLTPDPVTDYACRFLEECGFVWHLHYFLNNAVDKAASLLMVRLEVENERENRSH